MDVGLLIRQVQKIDGQWKQLIRYSQQKQWTTEITDQTCPQTQWITEMINQIGSTKANNNRNKLSRKFNKNNKQQK